MVLVRAWPEEAAVGYVYHYYLAPHARGCGLGAELHAYAIGTSGGRGIARRAQASPRQTHARSVLIASRAGATRDHGSTSRESSIFIGP